MKKTPAMFQKEPPTTLGAASMRYLVSEGGNYVVTELRKAEYYVPSLFFDVEGGEGEGERETKKQRTFYGKQMSSAKI